MDGFGQTIDETEGKPFQNLGHWTRSIFFSEINRFYMQMCSEKQQQTIFE